MTTSFSKCIDKLGWEYYQLDTPNGSYRFTPSELKKAQERAAKVQIEELFSLEKDILFECPTCGQSMMVNRLYQGKETRCIGCFQKIIIP